MIGRTLAHYHIHEKIGAGGMGEVYRAHDDKLHRDVAIKVLRSGGLADDTARKRIGREARTASSLNHPNICTVYEVGDSDDQVYIAMEYVNGAQLAQLARNGLAADSVIRYAIQISDGLAFAHSRGVIHRDLKGSNILVTSDGRVKLVDFGLAKRILSDTLGPETQSDSFETGTGHLAGTLAYMAPEVLQGKASDARSDMWALGVVLYEMATGQLPFKGRTGYELTSSILQGQPEPLPDRIPEGLAFVINRCLRKEAGERYQSAIECRAALETLQSNRAGLRVTDTKLPAAGTLSIAVVSLLAIGISAAMIAARLRHSTATLSPEPRQMQLAILPHTESDDDQTTSAFGNGLAETLTARLAHLSENHPLQVVPMRELQLKGVTTLEQARQEFGVNRGLELTFHRSGDVMRTSYLLVDAQTLRSLHGDTITAPAADAFAIEDQVANSVAEALELELRPEEKRALVAHGTVQPEAYDFYLQGRGYLQDFRRPESLQSAMQVFNQALERDPKYAPALAGLGEVYWYKYESTKKRAWVDRARSTCTAAVATEPEHGEGHTCLGLIFNGTGNYGEARDEYGKAIELDPSNDRAYAGLAAAYEKLGQSEEAEKTYLRAISLRPNLSVNYNWLGGLYLKHGRFADAASMFSQVIALCPDSYAGYSNLASVYVMQDRYAEALPLYERSVAIRPTADNESNLATVYFDLKRYAEAAHIYENALKNDPNNDEVWGNLGDAYYWAPGMRSRAADAYRRAIALATDRLKVNARDADLLGYLAQYHAMVGEAEQAESYLAGALKIAPNDPYVLLSASLVYTQLGKDDQALASITKAVKAGLPANMLRDLPNFDRLAANPRFQKLLPAEKEIR